MLKQQLKQQLKLNQTLTQGISILQMSSFELQAFLQNEVCSNPFLQMKDSDTYHTNFSSNAFSVKNDLVKNEDIDVDAYIQNIPHNQSLSEYIIQQINLNDITPREVAHYLTYMLDENGYIDIDPKELKNKFKISPTKLYALVQKLQTLEPKGVFAKNLVECIQIQLKHLNSYDEIFEKILDNLELVAINDLKKLSKLVNTSTEDLKNRIAIIKSLNPKPGARFDIMNNNNQFIDAVIYVNDQELKVELFDQDYHNLLLDKQYYEKTIKASSQILSQQDKTFMQKKFTKAYALIQNLKKRDKTLLEVCALIAEKQKDFFFRGVLYFSSIKLKDIAKEAGINESTVSRAIANKYILCSFGIYPIKFFFSSDVKSTNNHKSKNVSSTKVKELIKELISQETNILSDEEIVKELRKFYIDISRRAVSKYRISLNIPSSNIRRKIKKL